MGKPQQKRSREMVPNVIVDGTRCLRRRLRGFNCSRCVESCRAEALSLDGRELQINVDACTRCGRCAAVCPSEVFTFSEVAVCRILPKSEPFLPMVISCHRQTHGEMGDIIVPCLGFLSLEMLLFLALHRQNECIINMTGCTACENAHIIVEIEAAISCFDQLQLTRPTAKIIAAKNPSDMPPPPPGDRRSFLVNVGRDVLSLIRDRFGSEAPLPAPVQPHRRRVPEKTELLLHAVNALDHQNKSIITEMFLPQLIVQSSCTPCPRCTGICPTGALKRTPIGDDQNLIFLAEKCTACGLCVDFCKKNSLTLKTPGYPNRQFAHSRNNRL